jgi:Arc/MetJ-type ribon-helix-helix transcriptional regulator
MAHIGVSVDESTKQEWSDYVEQSNYGSMSELVRAAVRTEIRREGGGDGIPREVERQLSEMIATQQTLQNQVSELSEGFEDVSEAATGDQYPEEIVELANDIAGELDEIHRTAFGEKESEVQEELHALAEDYGTDYGKVNQALQYLEDNLSYVRTEPLGPSDYYRVTGQPQSREDY